MKKLFIWSLIVLSAIAVLYGYIHSQQGRIVCNRERFGVVMKRGYYRSFFVNYSKGETLNAKGELVYVWCCPYFSHTSTKLRMVEVSKGWVRHYGVTNLVEYSHSLGTNTGTYFEPEVKR